MSPSTPGMLWPTIVAAAALLVGPGIALTAAEQTAPAPPTESLRPVDTSSLRGTGDLPSAVSPAIERFMQHEGRHLMNSPTARDRAPAERRTAASPSARPSTSAATSRPTGRPVIPPPRVASAAAAAPPATSDLTSAGPSPLEVDLTLKAAPFDATDVRFPINLATALRLSDARPLIVAAAQAGVWVAEAQLTRAKVLWVPLAVLGFDYIRHDGGGPDFNKGIMTAPSVNYFMGGTGVNLNINTTDAYFEPLVARQMLNSANWDIQAAKNDALLQTADAYFRVHQHRGRYAGALYTVEQGRGLVEKVYQLSKDLVPKDEVDRARNMLSDLEQRAVSARQDWRVASADLTQVLRLDPRAVVEPLEHDHVQITLIDPGKPLDELMPVALRNRPELASRRARVLAAETRVRREKMRPILPSIMVGGFQHSQEYLQAGIFGIGPNSSLDQWRGRSDISLQMVWQLEGLGLGNLGRIKQERGRESASLVELRRTQDMIAADVTRALARVQSGAARVLQADRSMRTGIITFKGHLEGIEQTRRFGDVLVLTYRPQEAVYSLEQLNVSFSEYFSTIAEYNRAQFELFHALGYPAAELALLRPPGDILPVNTMRPAYLPPVGTGPPPATR